MSPNVNVLCKMAWNCSRISSEPAASCLLSNATSKERRGTLTDAHRLGAAHRLGSTVRKAELRPDTRGGEKLESRTRWRSVNVTWTAACTGGGGFTNK